MRRLLLAILLALLGVVAFAVPADAAPNGKIYTVSRTVGPYNGEANWHNDLPGQPPDGEAVVVECKHPGANADYALRGKATINHKTSHGTTRRDVISLDVIGFFWNTEVDHLQYGTFVETNGRKGWNSVTLTITCRHHNR